jgi:hypothetical protein
MKWQNYSKTLGGGQNHLKGLEVVQQFFFSLKIVSAILMTNLEVIKPPLRVVLFLNQGG